MHLIKLLLVDDEVGYVNVLSKRMSKRAFAVTTANSGSAAIQILRNNDFDAVVMDLKMGDMNGIDVLKIFKVMAPEMPVIILTGHGSETSAREGIQCGAYDYLIKPCNLEEIIDKIRIACKQ